MGIVRILLLLVMVILGGAFAMLNQAPVTLNYYFGEYTMPLALLLLGMLLVGAFLGALVSMPARWRLRRELSAAKRKNRQAEPASGQPEATKE